MLSEKDKFILSEKDSYNVLSMEKGLDSPSGKAGQAEFLLKK
jgi:hypothetical protein